MRDELDVVGRERDVEDEERLTRDFVDELEVERLTRERVRGSVSVVERRCFVRNSLRERALDESERFDEEVELW